MAIDLNSYLYDRIFNIIHPYVPPCERNPYYKDPRDVDPSVDDSFRHPFVNSDATTFCIDMRKCSKCGIYFQPDNPFDSDLCHDCRN